MRDQDPPLHPTCIVKPLVVLPEANSSLLPWEEAGEGAVMQSSVLAINEVKALLAGL